MDSGTRLRDQAAEPALAAAVFGERLLEHGAVEVGPMRGDEDELAIGSLPQQEVGEPLLAAGADDEIGIRQIGRVEKESELLGCDLLEPEAPGAHFGGEPPCRPRNLLPRPVV